MTIEFLHVIYENGFELYCAGKFPREFIKLTFLDPIPDLLACWVEPEFILYTNIPGDLEAVCGPNDIK